MYQCVVVFDESVLLSPTMEINKDLKNLIESNSVYAILWTSHIQSSINVKSYVEYDYEINGHINGMKSMKHIRLLNKSNASLLSKPFILIDRHAKSIDYGGFDYTINIDKYKVKDIIDVYYDLGKIVDEIYFCCNNWFDKRNRKFSKKNAPLLLAHSSRQ